jgi:hypothetical protein
MPNTSISISWTLLPLRGNAQIEPIMRASGKWIRKGENSAENPTDVHADKINQIEPYVSADKTRSTQQKLYAGTEGHTTSHIILADSYGIKFWLKLWTYFQQRKNCESIWCSRTLL